jgi:hypothetical protein
MNLEWIANDKKITTFNTERLAGGALLQNENYLQLTLNRKSG